MKISALRLFNVKRFAGRGVAIEGIGDGVNVLSAVNEFGKSTSFEALHALFFQPHSSTAGDVRNLRPYSGGNPLVEADIATAEGRFRIAKQFYGGRSARVTEIDSGRLVAQADEAENFIAGLIRGGTAGPAGLLWVRQGITGIEKRSRAEEDGERQVRTSLLESVQGEVEAVTGGRRMADILDATDESLGKLVTPTGRPKAGERYAAAIEERDRLQVEEAKLREEVTALRDALNRKATEGKRLAELDDTDDREERRKSIEAAEAAFAAAKAQGETLRTAEAELGLATARRDTAAGELEAFRAALERIRNLDTRTAEAERKRADAAGRKREAGETAAKARADAEAAEANEQEARKLLDRLEAAMRARDAADRLAELEKRLADAEALRAQIEKADAELSAVRLPEKALDELEALETDIARLRAVAEAARPSVSVAYEPGAAAVLMDGKPIGDGEERSYDGRTELALPGIGTITLRSNQPARSDDGLRKAEEKRRARLQAIGAEDLAAARARHAEAGRRQADLRELKARLSLLAPDGLARLAEEVAARRGAVPADLELKEDPEQVRAALAAAETRRLAARQAWRESEPAQASAADAFVAAETALASLAGERGQVELLLGPHEKRTERESAFAEKLAENEAKLAAAATKVEQLRAQAVDLEGAQATLQRVRSVSQAVEKEIAAIRDTLIDLNAQIRTRSDEAVEENWQETAEALEAATARAAAFEREVAVLQKLRDTLEAARARARDLYLKPVMTELRPLLGLLFDDVSITFDDKTLLPQTIQRNGQQEDVERLSGGMREQLSVLTRLAFARLLARDGRPAPVILDDALVYSDDERIEKMFNALHMQAHDQQIIVFSCRQRAFRELGGNILHMTDWQPSQG